LKPLAEINKLHITVNLIKKSSVQKKLKVFISIGRKQKD